MSPFIVTTRHLGTKDTGWSTERRAVATLEEARTEVFDCLTATEDLAEHYGGGADRLARSIEPGEYIETPDGTTIEVERQPDDFDVNAFNAKRAGQR